MQMGAGLRFHALFFLAFGARRAQPVHNFPEIAPLYLVRGVNRMTKPPVERSGPSMKIKHGKILTQEEREYLANEREKRKNP